MSLIWSRIGRPGAAGFAALAIAGLLMAAGCGLTRNQVVSSNPMVVRAASFDVAWEATVRAVDEFFEINEENRLARRITTEPVTGATVFEPWRGDSVGFDQRLESTLQTIRRFAIARVEPLPDGGYGIDVQVFKELEDLDRPEKQTGGLATFPQDSPVVRSREIIGPVPTPIGWIPKGRDPDLEQRILRHIRAELLRQGVAL